MKVLINDSPLRQSVRTNGVNSGLMIAGLLMMLLSVSVRAGGTPATAPCDAQAQRLGEQVIAVGEAIKNPDAPGAMSAITELGTDSRYYVMVRGWLMLAVQGDQSILEASESGSRPDLEARVAFLKQAIRAIDLE